MRQTRFSNTRQSVNEYKEKICKLRRKSTFSCLALGLIFVKEWRRYVQMPLCPRTLMLNVEMIRAEQVNISIRSTISNFGFISPSSWVILRKWPLKKQRRLHFLWLIPQKGVRHWNKLVNKCPSQMEPHLPTSPLWSTPTWENCGIHWVQWHKWKRASMM